MPRGRPRKVVVELDDTEKSIREIIADALHEFCYIPGCMTKVHLEDADTVISRLASKGYSVVESYGDE